MKILDRYINFTIIKILISSLFIFCFFAVFVDVVSNLDEIIDRKISIDILVQYYLAFLPTLLPDLMTFCCLIAVLLGFSSLNNNNEVIVMRASGLSFWQITRPALVLSLVVCGIIFLLNEKFVPNSAANMKKIKNENMILESDRARKKKEQVKNITFYGQNNRLYFIDSFNPDTNELMGININEYDNNTVLTRKVVAYRGKWTGITWKFFECNITTYGEGGINEPLKVKVYDEKLMDIKETPEDFMNRRINVKAMNMLELKEYIKRFSNSGATKALNSMKVDFHHKIAYPFGPFIVVLTGLPFVLMLKSRKGITFISIGIAIGVAFLFMISTAVAIAFGKGGALPPLLAAWTAPIVFVGVALLFIESTFMN